LDPLAWVLLAIVLGDSDWFKLLGIGFVGDVGGEGGEAVTVIIVVVLACTVPSPCFDNTPRIATVIGLLPEIYRRSVVKAGLEWSLALRPCAMLVARLVSRLFYFLFGFAIHELMALVALPTVSPPVPRASSGGATDQCSVTMALRPRRQVPSGRHWMLLIELHEHTLG
jgi:hypothetical protein